MKVISFKVDDDVYRKYITLEPAKKDKIKQEIIKLVMGQENVDHRCGIYGEAAEHYYLARTGRHDALNCDVCHKYKIDQYGDYCSICGMPMKLTYTKVDRRPR